MVKIQYGILGNQKIRDFFEKEINSRKFCPECRKEREKQGLADKDKKDFDSYSNLLPGFSSLKISIHIDVLIIAEAHGGGGEKYFRQQNSLNKEVAEIGKYYLVYPIDKFHQMEMRKLFWRLNYMRKVWVFADLIRCYVYQKKKENLEIAIKHCQKYLEKEIDFLRPKVVICIGRMVAENFFGIKDKEKLKHGDKREVKLNDKKITIIWSYFPSRNTADYWVANKGWDNIITRLKNEKPHSL